MGFNTTVVVCNDALHLMSRDPEFGENLSKAILQVPLGHSELIAVPILNHTNPVHVVETHHADHLVPVLVGGNIGKVVEELHLGYRDTEIDLLHALARKHNYTLKLQRR